MMPTAIQKIDDVARRKHTDPVLVALFSKALADNPAVTIELDGGFWVHTYYTDHDEVLLHVEDSDTLSLPSGELFTGMAWDFEDALATAVSNGRVVGSEDGESWLAELVAESTEFDTESSSRSTPA